MSYNTENMDNIYDLISLDEINKLLSELKSEETSILRKTPAEIDQIPDLVEREKQKQSLEFYNEVMVWPLIELADRICMAQQQPKIDFTVLNNRSIRGRQAGIKKVLVSKGCTPEIMLKVIPKTPAEVNLLEEARDKGFNLGFEKHHKLDNEDRLLRASQYLETLNTNNYSSQFNRQK